MSSSNLSSSLHKGKACANCRRRKIRCDGARPICRSCRSKPEQYGDCEYTDSGFTATQILEEKIGLLEARLEELQRAEPTSSLVLHNPYSTPAGSAGPSNLEDASSSLRHELLQVFMSHASVVGLFLEKDRFLTAASRNQLSPSLVHVINLWGATLSTHTRYDEEPLLYQAVQSISLALSNPERQGDAYTHRIMETIQAEHLLSQYFFYKGRVLEGNLHMITAISLVVSTRMHQIGSPSMAGLRSSLLEPPKDAVEEGERVHAFWAVLALNNCWTSIIGSTSNFDCTTNEGNRVDTPWPMDMELYTQEGYRHPPSSRTVLNFAEGVPDSGTSLRSLYAKAALTFEHATTVGSKHIHHVRNQGDVRRTARCFDLMDGVTLRLTSELYLLSGSFRGKDAQLYLTIIVLAHAATMQLHKHFTDIYRTSREKVVTSVKQVMVALRSLDPSSIRFVDPIMAPLSSMSYQLTIAEVDRLRSGSHSSEVLQEMLQLAEGLLNIMTPLASSSPLFATHLAHMRSLNV